MIDRSDLSVPLTGDYGNPVINVVTSVIFRPADLDFSLYQLDRYIRWNLTREEVETFDEYVKDEIARHCDRSRGMEVVAQMDYFKDPADAEKAASWIGNAVSFVSKDEQCAVYERGTSERTVLFTYAYGKTAVGLFLRRVLIDPATREIVDGYTWGKVSEPRYYTATEFRALGKCD